jgi:hypothetical protein
MRRTLLALGTILALTVGLASLAAAQSATEPITLPPLPMSPAAQEGPQGGEPWPLGQFVSLGSTPSCPSGFTCSEFEVAGCSGVATSAKGVLAQAYPRGRARGLAVFFNGGYGDTWWSPGQGMSGDFLKRLRDQKIATLQIRWVDSWLQATGGEDAGPAHLGCRPATAVQWIHENLYLPLGARPRFFECGFCITGNSGGASQVSYTISHYGLDSILNGVFPTSGPPHAAQEKGCLPGVAGYRYESWEQVFIDASYGFLEGESGPCALQDASLAARWLVESVDTGANDLAHPDTRIEFIIGALDLTAGPIHGADYFDLLEAESANEVKWTVVEGVAHTIQRYEEGLDRLESALTGK